MEDLVRDLVYEANGDIELAQHGIIYVDEIDKIRLFQQHHWTGRFQDRGPAGAAQTDGGDGS